MNNPLQQQIEALLEKEKPTVGENYGDDMYVWGFNEALSLCKQSLPKIIELIEKDTRERIKEKIKDYIKYTLEEVIEMNKDLDSTTRDQAYLKSYGMIQMRDDLLKIIN